MQYAAAVASRVPYSLGEVGIDAIEHVIELCVGEQAKVQRHWTSTVKVGRNQPCPCGSGKKYKQCCLAADEAATAAARDEQRRNEPPAIVTSTVPGWGASVDSIVERLEHMSNNAVDLIHAGELDEAERVSRQLLNQFPTFPDGHMRLGQLFKARGLPKKAAEHLRKAAAVARAADEDPALPLSLEDEADTLDPPRS